MNSFWECDRLFFEDLPTVRSLISHADLGILAREIAKMDRADPGEGEVAVARETLEEILAIDVRQPSQKWVFLPFDYYSAEGPGCIKRDLDAALVRRRDFEMMKELADRESFCYSVEECRKAARREVKRLGNKYPNLYSWTLTSWKKTLSYRVWMQGEYSRKERYQILASIVRDMTFFGTTWEEARGNQHAVSEGLVRDVKSAEKGKVRTNPIELLIRDYGLESSTDDYESEYDNRMNGVVSMLNHNAAIDLHRRVAGLVRREKRAEKRNFHTEFHAFDEW